MESNDTIVAVASPPGSGPWGIVRLSGPRALSLADTLFEPSDRRQLAECDGFSALPGRLRLTGGLAAPARLYLFRAPHSYTTEDLCEIHTVGSPPLLAMIVEALTDAGAVLAEPGEFTRRAFLNGRLALHQAEAVLQLIHAGSEAELKQAVEQLSGDAADIITRLRDRLLRLLSRLELNIDFSDQDVTVVSDAELTEQIDAVAGAIDELLAIQTARPLPESGLPVVLTGPPNAGKSTLFNALSDTATTIVSPQAGTTRDAITGLATIDGIAFRLIDTAGLDATPGTIAQAARRAAEQAQGEALLELLVLDGTAEAIPERFRAASSTERLVVINKSDQPLRLPPAGPAIRCSALSGSGLEAVRQALVAAVGRPSGPAPAHRFIPNARHRTALQTAAEALTAAGSGTEAGVGGEFVALDLRIAVDALKAITGEITTDEILGQIFADFCIGK